MEQVIPTKGYLRTLKRSYALALMGENLMEKKKNILVREMMQLRGEVALIRDQIAQTYQVAYQALQDANITLGIVGDIVKAIPIDKGINISFRSVMGIDLPVLTHAKSDVKLSYGLTSTNTKFDYAYQAFLEVKHLTVKLAAIDNSTYRLANAIRKSQKRVNALKHVLIPRMEEQMKFIALTLEEHEREEFIRMKVVKTRKEKQK